MLAVRLQFRRLGLGTKLLGLAHETAEARGKPGLSVIVSDANSVGHRLYERCGYRESGIRPMVKENWENDGQNWVPADETPQIEIGGGMSASGTKRTSMPKMSMSASGGKRTSPIRNDLKQTF